jgi:hypothetical protein
VFLKLKGFARAIIFSAPLYIAAKRRYSLFMSTRSQINQPAQAFDAFASALPAASLISFAAPLGQALLLGTSILLLRRAR